jgi:hypothetical protein
MKKKLLIPLLSIYFFTLVGCHNGVGSTDHKNPAPSATANTNAAPPQAGAANPQPDPAKPADPSKKQTTGVSKDSPQWLLQGTYAIAEVQHDGIVDMVKSDTTTEILFTPPASFSRRSKKGGKVYHTDSGQYAIEGDTLTLQIVLSNKQIQQPPAIKNHKFSISPDGSEFKLTSEKNNTAVFRRISQ